MTSERMTTTTDRTSDPFSPGLQRLLALSGVGFAVLFFIGFLISGGDTPDYGAADAAWTNWAKDNETNNRLSVLLILLAGFEFLHFAGALRTSLGQAEKAARGFKRLTHVQYAGAITGIAGIVMAVTMIGVASAEGDKTNAVVARAVTQAAAGPFLLASVGFAVMLLAASLLILRTGAHARWTGIVALVGSVAFVVTFLTILGDEEDSPAGIGFPIGFLALIVFSIATSLAHHRAVGLRHPAQRDAVAP